MASARWVLDRLVTLALAVAAAYGVGELFVWLWAPAPTPENSSPPPEAFLFLWGALIGFAAVIVLRILVARRRWQRQS
jgi:polyferredoxin